MSPETAGSAGQDRVTDSAAWWLDEDGNDTCPCHPPPASVSRSTCECAVGQIKPVWDYRGRLACEDCHGLIPRARKMSGQNARPGEVAR